MALSITAAQRKIFTDAGHNRKYDEPDSKFHQYTLVQQMLRYGGRQTDFDFLTEHPIFLKNTNALGLLELFGKDITDIARKKIETLEAYPNLLRMLTGKDVLLIVGRDTPPLSDARIEFLTALEAAPNFLKKATSDQFKELVFAQNSEIARESIKTLEAHPNTLKALDKSGIASLISSQSNHIAPELIKTLEASPNFLMRADSDLLSKLLSRRTSVDVSELIKTLEASPNFLKSLDGDLFSQLLSKKPPYELIKTLGESPKFLENLPDLEKFIADPNISIENIKALEEFPQLLNSTNSERPLHELALKMVSTEVINTAGAKADGFLTDAVYTGEGNKRFDNLYDIVRYATNPEIVKEALQQFAKSSSNDIKSGTIARIAINATSVEVVRETLQQSVKLCSRGLTSENIGDIAIKAKSADVVRAVAERIDDLKHNKVSNADIVSLACTPDINACQEKIGSLCPKPVVNQTKEIAALTALVERLSKQVESLSGEVKGLREQLGKDATPQTPPSATLAGAGKGGDLAANQGQGAQVGTSAAR